MLKIRELVSSDIERYLDVYLNAYPAFKTLDAECRARQRERNLRNMELSDVDYIGIGPYTETSTKKNLAPVLGLEGIRNLHKEMVENEIEIAHVAIGGIRKEDVVPLMETGINGIAVSGAIAFASDIKKETEEFMRLLKPFMH